MTRYIRIKNNQVVGYPITEINLLQAYPHIDLKNLPADILPVVESQEPTVSWQQRVAQPRYSIVGRQVREEFSVEALSTAELDEKLKLFTEARPFASWTFSMSLGQWQPPTPRPQSPGSLVWDESSRMWINPVTGIVGQADYLVPGSQMWQAPPGVTSVCVVCIGGGAGGGAVNGGGGGGLAWRNNIAVVPGQSYVVRIGSGGAPNSNGQPSFFIDQTTVCGFGGVGSLGGNTTNGGRGGNGGNNSPHLAGGGGAGGYTGNGGNGGAGMILATAGAGGGGDGGVGGPATTSSTVSATMPTVGTTAVTPSLSGSMIGGIVAPSTMTSQPLGSVTTINPPASSLAISTFGQTVGQTVVGNSVTNQPTTNVSARAMPGQGASVMGAGVRGSTPGFGSGGAAGNPGQAGAVRIIWGRSRAYPSTLTQNQP